MGKLRLPYYRMCEACRVCSRVGVADPWASCACPTTECAKHVEYEGCRVCSRVGVADPSARSRRAERVMNGEPTPRSRSNVDSPGCFYEPAAKSGSFHNAFDRRADERNRRVYR